MGVRQLEGVKVMAISKKTKVKVKAKIKVKGNGKKTTKRVKGVRKPRAPRNSGVVLDADLTEKQRILIARIDANEKKLEDARKGYQVDLAALLKSLGGARTFEHPVHGLYTIMSGRKGESLFWRPKPLGRAVEE